MRLSLLSIGVVAAVAALVGVDGTFIFGATTGTVAAGTAAGAAGLAALGGLALGVGKWQWQYRAGVRLMLPGTFRDRSPGTLEKLEGQERFATHFFPVTP